MNGTSSLDRRAAVRPVVFVHVMKTGGTTFLEQVIDHVGPQQVWPPQVRHLAPGVEGEGTPFSYGLAHELLRTRPDELLKHQVIASHLPAVVADVVADAVGVAPPIVSVLRSPVDRVVSHLKQTQRHHASEARTLDEVYEDERFKEQFFTNFQTKVFSARRRELTEPPAGSVTEELLKRPIGGGRTVEDRLREIPEGNDKLVEMAALAPEGWDVDRVRWAFLSCPAWWIPVDDERVVMAQERLEQLEVVGLTERYEAFLQAIERRLGWRLQRIEPRRRAPGHERVSDALRRRILDDNAADMELYERACELAP
jgi:hypothetical protein